MLCAAHNLATSAPISTLCRAHSTKCWMYDIINLEIKKLRESGTNHSPRIQHCTTLPQGRRCDQAVGATAAACRPDQQHRNQNEDLNLFLMESC